MTINIYDFLSTLREQDILITLDGEKLKINAPKGALTAELKTELAARKQDIITFLQRAAGVAPTVQLQPIEPVDRSAPLPLSLAQQRIWRLYMLDPYSSELNVPVAWQLTGQLDVPALQTALDKMVTRQESLRTCFIAQPNGEASLHIKPTGSLPLRLMDVRSLPNGEREARRLAEEEATIQPFDLQHTAVTATLYQYDNQAYILLLNFHQIIFDWGAAGALINDLTTFYTQAVRQEDSTPDSLTVQYVDYAHWQQNKQESAQGEAQRAYWQEKLGQPYTPLRLPRRTASQTSRAAARESIIVPAALTQDLKTLSQQEGATLFMVLLSALNSLLYLPDEQEDLLLFSTAGTNRLELKEVIGLFANPISYRTSLHGRPTFRQLLDQVKQVALEAHSHQDFPFERMIELLPIQGNRTSLFQVLFLYQHQPTPSLQLPEVTAQLLTVGVHAPAFALRLFMEEEAVAGSSTTELRGWLEYQTELFDAEVLQQFVADWLALLEVVALEPTTAVVDLPRTWLTMAGTDEGKDTTAVVIPPRTPTEKILLTIWEELLHTSPISIHDDYFALGGHSLLATQLFHHIKTQLGAHLSLATLLQASTIAELATIIDGQKKAPSETGTTSGWNSLVKIKTGDPNRRPLFLIHGAGGNILLYRDLAHHLHPDQPVYGLQAQGLDGSGDYLTSFEEMAARYLREIRAVQPHGPYMLGGYCLGGGISYEMAQQLRQAGEEVALVAMFESFNVQSNPLVLTKKYQILQKIQNLWFHAANLFTLPPREMAAFFGQKTAVAKERLIERAHILSQNIRQRFQNSNNGKPVLPHIIIDKVNDTALEHYHPQPYADAITLFRPQKDFIGAEDPYFGWGDLAKVQVHRLNVNPRGMLIEPYVRELAALLQTRIDETKKGND